MSFSSEIKKELCVIKDLRQEEASAMLYGIMFAARPENGRPQIMTENIDLIDAVRGLTKAVFPDIKHETVRLVKNGGSLFTFRIKARYDAVAAVFGDYSAINTEIVAGDDACSSAFLRGIFAMCGSVTDPTKGYHLEMVLPENARAAVLHDFICEHGMAIKTTLRSRRSPDGEEKTLVLYAKESELIEDFLTYIGAAAHSLELMRIKIYKDFRNRANRSVNCESANIDKTVNAANKIIEDINYIYEKRGADFLPEVLRETAKLRLDNFDLPLSELCRLFSKPISRSGLNHRLQKISRFAEEIRMAEGDNKLSG